MEFRFFLNSFCTQSLPKIIDHPEALTSFEQHVGILDKEGIQDKHKGTQDDDEHRTFDILNSLFLLNFEFVVAVRSSSAVWHFTIMIYGVRHSPIRHIYDT